MDSYSLVEYYSNLIVACEYWKVNKSNFHKMSNIISKQKYFSKWDKLFQEEIEKTKQLIFKAL